MKTKQIVIAMMGVLICIVCLWSFVKAGDLNPPGAPGPTMKTLVEIEPRHPIYSTQLPLNINESGSYYFAESIVFSQIDTDAIMINAANVTIDLNGFTLSGPGKTSGSSGNGITTAMTRPVSNITVRNGTVNNFAGLGIYLGGSHNQVSELRVVSIGQEGIWCSWNSKVENCIVSLASWDGILVEAGSVVVGCSVNGSSHYAGIFATASVVKNCAVSNCTTGILGESSIIQGCTCNGNESGILCNQSVIRECQVFESGDYGIFLSGACHVSGNNIYGCGEYGLYAMGNANYVIQNSATGCGVDEFFVGGSNYMPLTGDNANYDG